MNNIRACKLYRVEYGYEASNVWTDKIKDIVTHLESGFIREYDGGFDLECSRAELLSYMATAPLNNEVITQLLKLIADSDGHNDDPDTLHWVCY